jgi:hypothetical protein
MMMMPSARYNAHQDPYHLREAHNLPIAIALMVKQNVTTLQTGPSHVIVHTVYTTQITKTIWNVKSASLARFESGGRDARKTYRGHVLLAKCVVLEKPSWAATGYTKARAKT